MKVCNRCLFNENTPGIKFNADGTCNYCDLHNELEKQYPTGDIIGLGRKLKTKNEYDCVIGISGGCDSSFMLYLAVKVMGLKPLAVHFNNGFNSEISISNMKKMCGKLGVTLEIRKIDPKEYNDIYHSFFKAGLPDIEAVTDLALMASLYESAYKHKIKTVFVGHSFRTEGISPLGYSYMDSGYVRSVQKTFGTLPIKTLPELRFLTFMKYLLSGIKRIRPLYYIDYDKEQIKEFLSNEFGWQWYGGLHKESIISDFVKNYWIWQRYGVDKRVTEYSGLVRTGTITRDEANEILSIHPDISDWTHAETTRILGFNPDEYLNYPKKTYKDFKNYKRLFKIFRPLFWIFLKLDRIPLSFYKKYCV